MEPIFEHQPGSPEAIAQGCTCPPQAGPGAVFGSDGTPTYVCDQDCPMHGLEAMKRAIATGQVRIIRPDPEHDEPTLH